MAADGAPDDLRDFLRGETDARNFRHADHVRMAFEILTRHPRFLDAATVYAGALRMIAARAGNPGAYHETITLAFLSLIAERLAAQRFESFADLTRAHPELLAKHALTRWYAPDRLQSAAARATFILPAPVAP